MNERKYYLGSLHYHKGVVLDSLRQKEQALAAFDTSINHYKKYFNTKNREIARGYNAKGVLEQKYGNHEAALKYFHQALLQVCDTFDNQSDISFPPLSSLSPEPFIMTALRNKASTWFRYLQTKCKPRHHFVAICD